MSEIPRDRFGTYYHPPQTLAQAIADGVPLVFEEEAGSVGRFMAEAFVVAGGLAFAEIGWDVDHPGHPLHFIEGEVSGLGPWRVGECTIRKLDHGDPLAPSYNDWRAYRAALPPERRSTRESCWRAFADLGILPPNMR